MLSAAKRSRNISKWVDEISFAQNSSNFFRSIHVIGYTPVVSKVSKTVDKHLLKQLFNPYWNNCSKTIFTVVQWLLNTCDDGYSYPAMPTVVAGHRRGIWRAIGIVWGVLRTISLPEDALSATKRAKNGRRSLVFSRLRYRFSSK